MGYNFSIAGVWGHVRGPYARGGAESVGFLGPDGPAEAPIPNGMVWNMVYDPQAPAGTIGTVTHEQLWQRLVRDEAITNHDGLAGRLTGDEAFREVLRQSAVADELEDARLVREVQERVAKH